METTHATTTTTREEKTKRNARDTDLFIYLFVYLFDYFDSTHAQTHAHVIAHTRLIRKNEFIYIRLHIG